jgi:DNA uptake protein ComE-like DNA-binding protein
MKKAIGAFVSGLLLSGAVAAVYQAFRKREKQAQPFGEAQQEAKPKERQQVARRRRSQSRPRPLSGLLDLNKCSQEELASLEGLDNDNIGRIIENRPYRNKIDLMSRMVIPEATYVLISDFVTASEPGEPVKVAS